MLNTRQLVLDVRLIALPCALLVLRFVFLSACTTSTYYTRHVDWFFLALRWSRHHNPVFNNSGKLHQIVVSKTVLPELLPLA